MMTIIEHDRRPVEVAGKRIDLPDGRSVFLGRYQGKYVLRFINGDRETKLLVSHEAMHALMQLFTDDDSAEFMTLLLGATILRWGIVTESGVEVS